MAMTLRLTDEETEALRRQAERDHRSMQEVARLAIREHVARAEKARRVEEITREGIQRHAGLLERLAK